MKRIFHLLKKIEKNYPVYIGRKSLLELVSFLNGFECAIHEIAGERVNFNAKFQIYIEHKIGTVKNCHMHWSCIMMNNRDDEEAFDQFFVYLEEFRSVLETPSAIETMQQENWNRLVNRTD